MKMFRLLVVAILFMNAILPLRGETLQSANGYSIKSDNVLRFYRIAIPVTNSSFERDFDCDYSLVLRFWDECELYLNRTYLSLGFCFDVVRGQALVMKENNLIDEDYCNAVSYGTMLLDEVVGTENYDIGMWVTYRPEYSENTGLSIEGGAYAATTKASGYAVPDTWVIAHEVGHLFGANHTMDGTLMDVGGDFFSLESIERIRRCNVERNGAYYSDVERTTLVGSNNGGNYVYGIKVQNTAPVFDGIAMKSLYRVPQGACLSFYLHVDDAENDNLNYAAVGDCFAAVAPSENSVIDYAPSYVADLYYDDYYIVWGTDIPSMSVGSYDISFVVNDCPADCSYRYGDILDSPFYSLYGVWSATVQIVAGTAFEASLYPQKSAYVAGEEVTVEWGVNRACFSESTRLRILLSDDYGKSYKHILATDVPALDGMCKVTMPNVNIGEVEVDFDTALRTMRGGIIRIEEIGGIAFTLTESSPYNGGGFMLEASTGVDGASCTKECGECYDTAGRRLYAPQKGINIAGGKKFLYNSTSSRTFNCRPVR